MSATIADSITEFYTPVGYEIEKPTVMTRNTAKYTTRTVPSDAASGYATIEKVEGNTVAWNQLLKQGKLVDMGLPSGLLWATCNIDITQEDGFAASPFQYECSFFSWGNIDGHNPISNNAFDYNWGGVNAHEPWYEGQPYGSTPGSTLTTNIVAGDTYDAARYNLGSLFKMPTSAQFQELFSNCDFVQADGTTVIDASVTDKRVTVNGTVGIYLKSKVNGNLIFFSASGYGDELLWKTRGNYGRYWTSLIDTSRYAQNLYFYVGGVNPQHATNRYYGVPVRAVVNPNTIDTGHNNHKYYVTKDINHDFTAIFGAGNEPTTVADFEAWLAQNGLPGVADYNAGELLSCKMESLKSVGFNQFDYDTMWGTIGTKGTNNDVQIMGSSATTLKPLLQNINFLPNTSYCFTYKQYCSSGSNIRMCILYTDGTDEEIGRNNTSEYVTLTKTSNASKTVSNAILRYQSIGVIIIKDICINISDPAKNGTYQPYMTDSADIDVTTITGINTATNVRETIFPNGIRSAGNIHDTLTASEAVVRIGGVNLGTLTWSYGPDMMCFASFNLIKMSPVRTVPVVCNKYQGLYDGRAYVDTPDKTVFNRESPYGVLVKDSNITDSDIDEHGHIAKLGGVILFYERATPITYTDLQDANGNPLNPRYKVEQGGTEQVLPVNMSTPTTVAPTLTTTYTKLAGSPALPTDYYLNTRYGISRWSETRYGVEWDTSNPSPTLTRIGEESLHALLPVQSLMRRCLVSDTGDVVYLNAEDTTKLMDGTSAILDGTAGQVMVEIPQHYRRFVFDGTKRQVWLSLYPVEGYTEVPTMYVSAYEAALDRTNLKLSSVVNTTTQYRGGNNTSGWDGTYRSLLGMPVTGINTTTFRTYARNRGTGWEMYACEVHKIIYWLFCVEYATFNSQLEYNSSLTGEGYKQGGLGRGVTTWDTTNWNNYNGRNPLIPCGATNSLGNKTGTISVTPTAGGGYTPPTFNVPSYRGIENPFGHIWKWSDGAMMVYENSTPNYYTCPLSKHSSWASSKNSNYELKGTLATSSGVYAKRHLFGNDGEVVPDQAGGTGTSATTYLCDYYYITLSSTRVLAWGGIAFSGTDAGLGSANAFNGFSTSYLNCGSRLCYFPF